MTPETDEAQLAPALGIVTGVGLLLGGALISGLTTDLSGGSWKIRVKLVALAGQSFIAGTGGGGAIVVGLALLLAVHLAPTPTVANPAAALGAWALGITFASLLVDLTYLVSAHPGPAPGPLAGILLGDVAALAVLAAAAWWGWSVAHR